MRWGVSSKISGATRMSKAFLFQIGLVCRLDNASSPLGDASLRHRLDSLNVSNDFQNK